MSFGQHPDKPVPPSASESWASLNQGFDDLIALEDPKLASYSLHGTLYSAVYNYLCSPRRRSESREAAPKASGEDVYGTITKKLDARLEGILQGAADLRGEALLEYYSTQWAHYALLAKSLEHVCSYLTRHWLRAVAKQDDIYTVHAHALERWKSVFVDGLQRVDQKLTKALLNLVESHRSGISINSEILKSVLASLAMLGRSGKHGETETLEVYEDVFEKSFLTDAEKCFRQSSERVAQEPSEEHQNTAGHWLANADQLAAAFPSDKTREGLLQILKDIGAIEGSQKAEEVKGLEGDREGE
ncbi:hypothetical protein HYDPIDRAFT_28418 [Hydnomerulius pinastri MD-312]|uniref:Cullin N-terminal domain-containing protein n=1 Tax=Hydnomerulius pinastri MD-312 TaxID=994086 RepID=A0A0C9WFT7_9AGAM|nr:hypothetical protein HYDPIDRAFT_28418 [Hydnomerulius pinastri MD-312]